MKLNIKLPKFNFRTMTSIFFLLVVAAEVYLTFDYIYKNLHPADPTLDETKIIKADLKGYSQIYKDLNARTVYEPQTFDYKNSHPFQYGE